MRFKHIQHLYWRAGFGVLPNQLNALEKMKKDEIIESLFENSKRITPLKIDTSEIESILNAETKISSENQSRIQKLSREKTIDLNVAWVNRLINPSELLREKMTLFWANVFVCEDNNVVYIQQFNNMLRQHALGNFKDFVNAVSKEAAMTKYLNTKQNKKQKPNENFARELMELFTLGEGHYTENDIKESAKAFTGYSYNLNGEFVFRDKTHDASKKTFFGKTGNFKGEDIIDTILEQKQCAKFICEKVYRYFVNDVLNEDHIKQITNVFYKDYNIERLMRFVFSSDWFYNPENIGTKIKSPIEFLVGLNLLVPIEFNNPKQLLYIQKQLGQILLAPPNVAGWKGGKSWIDSNTIVLRLKLPSILLNNSYISKSEFGESNMMMTEKKSALKNTYGKRFQTKHDWETFNKNFKQVDIKDLQDYILLSELNPEASSYLNSLNKVSKKEYGIQLMSLPEYQMC